MLSFIKGELVEIFEDTIVVETNGVGFNIKVPVSVIEVMPRIGEEVKIYTYLNVREDEMSLFGFLTRDDLNVFKLLITVSGIGPKVGIGIMSNISADDLRYAVLGDDVNTIKSLPGIGPKTAQKLIIELKDKLKLEDVLNGSLIDRNNAKTNNNNIMIIRNDACEALVSLGYSRADALSAVKSVSDIEQKTSEDILKEALKALAKF